MNITLEMDSVSKRLGVLLKLEDDWDGDGAPPVNPSAKLAAEAFHKHIRDSVQADNGSYIYPHSNATTTGGVELTYSGERRIVYVGFEPDSDILDVAIKEPGTRSVRRHMNYDAALATISGLHSRK